MSWSLYVLPLHQAVCAGGLGWAASLNFARGLPDHAPGAPPPARVLDVLAAIRAAGCHGRAWFEVSDLAADSMLPECPDPMTCADSGGLDLGDVSLHVAGQADGKQPLQTSAAVAGVSFRKPSVRLRCTRYAR